MQIDWWTLALQAVNFLVLVWLLWRFLYRPVRAVIEKRRQGVAEVAAEAETAKRDAEEAEQRFEDDRAALAGERQEMLKTIHAELEADRPKVLDAARIEADRLIEEARGTIAAEREDALAEIREEIAAMAVSLAAGVLKEAGADVPHEVFLERLVSELDGLPAEEGERLRKDLAPDDARLTVATAEALAPAEQTRWRKRLGERLGGDERIGFATDPGIVGGAELRFPHAVLKLTWADYLEKAATVLRRDEADT